MFLSLIVAIAAVSVGTLSYTTQESEIETQRIQTVSTAVMDVSLEQIREKSDYAIVGEIIDIVPVVYVDPDRAKEKADNINPDIIITEQEILSDVKIKVEEDLFGQYDEKTITVRIPGGEIPTLKTVYEHSPTFEQGERVILFVGNGHSYSISEDNYTVLGLDQGTIKLGEQVVSKFANEQTTETEIKNKIKSLR